MTDIEFINKQAAELEAARAVELLEYAGRSNADAWLAMQSVADQIGSSSNVGEWGIFWAKPSPGKNRGSYAFSVLCHDGPFKTSTGAPRTLTEALEPEALNRAIQMRDTKVAELGGAKKRNRAHGTGDHLEAAVSATEMGRKWLDCHKQPQQVLLTMVRVADRYGASGIYPQASLAAHGVLVQFDDCAALIREFPLYEQAKAKAMSLRGQSPKESLAEVSRVTTAMATRLAVRSGVTLTEARTILRALMGGRSKAKLIRAVNEAAKMVE